MDETTTGTLMILGAAAGFGTIGVWGELAASIDLALATLLPVRFAIATAVVFVAAVASGWSLSRAGSPQVVATAVALGVVYAVLTIAFFVALRYLTAGLATIVLYTYPGFVFVLSAAFLDEPVRLREVVALALALAGIVLVVGTDAAGADPVGVGLVLVAALSYAVYTTASRSLVADAPTETLVLGVLGGSTVSMVAYGTLAGGVALPHRPAGWGIVLGLTVIGTLAPLFLFYRGLARLEASRVGVVSTAEPVVAVVLGALVLGEPVTPLVVAGGALVLAGVVLVQQSRARNQAAGPETLADN